MILQVHTEKELIGLVESLKEEIRNLGIKNELSMKVLKIMQSEIDKKPNVEIRETVTRELEKQTTIENVIVKTDSSLAPALKRLSERLSALENIKTDPAVMPTLKKLSTRLKCLESKKPELQIIKELTTHEIKTVGAASKQEIEDIKKSILEIKPIVNNLTTGVTSDDVLKLINKHVILSFINKLYGR